MAERRADTAPVALVSGASRGIGLEFVRQYAAAGWRVHACCRDPVRAAGLDAIAGGAAGRVRLHALDVTDHGAIEALAASLAGETIDLLVNNAGITGPRPAAGEAPDQAAWLATFAVNTIAPCKLALAFAGQLAAAERGLVVNMSSRLGSIAEAGGDRYAYRTSKAALNMVTRLLAADLGPRGITVVCCHPGWVRTDMGGPSAPLTPPESVAALRRLFERLTPADNGRFLNQDGGAIPW
jgi:NAD(P)-dependent dehydrogenase (short-subunit alcohol dehydrogenase family)